MPVPDVMLGSDQPLYNIGVVARMTGLSMATLRAWERRYRFPASERTSGGHRLYSERDVLRLRWVKERTDEGMQTAQAIQALVHQEQTGNLALVEQAPQASPHSTPVLHTGPSLETLETNLLEALMQRDLSKADLLLAEAMAFTTPDDLMIDVIGPVIAQLGAFWQAGQVSISTEHLATNYLRQRILMWMISAPPSRPVLPVLLACAPDEWHEGGLLILSALLRRRRWPVAYLGQAVPLPDLASFIPQIKPSAVVIVAMSEASATALMEWPRWMPEMARSGKPPLAYGGRIFIQQPDWRQRIPGIYLGDHYREGLNNLERLLASA